MDLRDFNHERKRDNPSNLCNLWFPPKTEIKGKRIYLIFLIAVAVIFERLISDISDKSVSLILQIFVNYVNVNSADCNCQLKRQRCEFVD